MDDSGDCAKQGARISTRIDGSGEGNCKAPGRTRLWERIRVGSVGIVTNGPPNWGTLTHILFGYFGIHYHETGASDTLSFCSFGVSQPHRTMKAIWRELCKSPGIAQVHKKG